MVYKEEPCDPQSLNLKLNVLYERIEYLENFKKQTISALNKISNNIIDLKQKREKYEELEMEIEKLKGKTEVVSEFKNQLSETSRIFSEQIGELRSMILDREKSFSKIETGFERINEIVKQIEPQAISRELEKEKRKIEEIDARVEKMQNLYDELIKRTEEVRKFLEKIKSFENLVEISNKIKKTESQIEDSKNYVDRIASKLEAMFEDMNEKILDIDQKAGKIEKIDELLKEMTPIVDKLQVAVENKADKKDIESIKNIGASGKLREKIESMESEIEEMKMLKSQLQDVLEIKRELSAVGSGNARKEQEINEKIIIVRDEMNELENSFEKGEIDEKSFMRRYEERKKKLDELKTELKKYKGKSISEKIKELQNQIQEIKESLKQENIYELQKKMKDLSKKMEYVEDFKHKLDMMKPKTLNELLSEKERLSQELRHLSEQYKNGTIDRETFESLFDRKQRNYIQISALIREKEKHGNILQEIRKVHNSISDFSQLLPKIKENSQEIRNLKEEIRSLKEGEPKEQHIVMKMKEVLDSLNLHKLPSDIEEIKTQMDKLSRYVEYELKFLELTSVLEYVENESTVLGYIYQIKTLVSELKNINKWSNEKEDYLKRLYSHLTEKFSDNKEIRDLYYSLA